MISNKDSGVGIELTPRGILHSCTVTLRLGEYRDVLLGLKDEKNYGRRGSDFFSDGSCVSEYITSQSKLAVVYPKGRKITEGLFFNLKGCGVGNIEDHNLTINSNLFRIKDKLFDVSDTPMDFRTETPIGERIRVGYEPLVGRHGYDHEYKLWDDVTEAMKDTSSVITESGEGTMIHEDKLIHAATLLDRSRTLEMSVYTNTQFIYLYTGNNMSGKDIGKGGCIIPNRGGVVLRPATGDDAPLPYDAVCVYKFTPKEII